MLPTAHSCAHGCGHRRCCLAVGETVFLLTSPLPSVGVSTGEKRKRQQNDSLSRWPLLLLPMLKAENDTIVSSENTALQITCPRAGWISVLLLEWLRRRCEPPGARAHIVRVHIIAPIDPNQYHDVSDGVGDDNQTD